GARTIAVVRLIRISHADLGRDDGVLAARTECLGQRLLRSAHPIRFGSVEAVEARIKCAIDSLDELGFFYTSVAAANFPATEAYRGDVDSGLTEWTVFHLLWLLYRCATESPA